MLPRHAGGTLRWPPIWRYSRARVGGMRRVVVIGTTGSGKSRLAERLAARTGLRVIELDAPFWGRDWQGAPIELFPHSGGRETRDDCWIPGAHHPPVPDLVWRP